MFVSRSTILAILALPAGAIGYAVASAILSGLAPIGETRDLLLRIVPLLVGGLCMVPFLLPVFDRVAKRDLAARRAQRANMARRTVGIDAGTQSGHSRDSAGSQDTTAMLDSMKATRGATDQSSLLLVAAFFGIPPTGEIMQHLTGAGRSVLHRVKNGGKLGSAEERAHLEVLAAFVRELREYLTHTMGSSSPDAAELERWLAAGQVEVGARTYRPIDALADRKLAIGALNTLRATLEGGLDVTHRSA